MFSEETVKEMRLTNQNSRIIPRLHPTIASSDEENWQICDVYEALEKYVLPMEVLKEEFKILKSNSNHAERHQKHLNQKGQVRPHEFHSPGLKPCHGSSC